jgi:hypothetical protein
MTILVFFHFSGRSKGKIFRDLLWSAHLSALCVFQGEGPQSGGYSKPPLFPP